MARPQPPFEQRLRIPGSNVRNHDRYRSHLPDAQSSYRMKLLKHPLIRAYDTVKKSDRIVQMGTQMRSYPQSGPAKEFLTSGQLGKILKVEQVRNGYTPYWMRYGSNEAANE